MVLNFLIKLSPWRILQQIMIFINPLHRDNPSQYWLCSQEASQVALCRRMDIHLNGISQPSVELESQCIPKVSNKNRSDQYCTSSDKISPLQLHPCSTALWTLIIETCFMSDQGKCCSKCAIK